jgi:hypothetical protein
MPARMLLIIGILFFTTNVHSQDFHFYIFLCVGQSNMEGQGVIQFSCGIYYYILPAGNTMRPEKMMFIK